MLPDLSRALRQETGDLHRRVESRPFMAALLAGQLGRQAYCMMLRNLVPIYTALESALTLHLNNPVIGALNLPALYRTQALHLDLNSLHGPGWQSEYMLLPACTDYCDHLLSLQVQAPSLLVAHAYVRYLGDLSGGQMLQKILAPSLNLSALRGAPGLKFYDFGEPSEVMRQAKQFRVGLDAMSSQPVLAAALVAEAKLAFELHITLYDELGSGTAPDSVPK